MMYFNSKNFKINLCTRGYYWLLDISSGQNWLKIMVTFSPENHTILILNVGGKTPTRGICLTIFVFNLHPIKAHQAHNSTTKSTQIKQIPKRQLHPPFQLGIISFFSTTGFSSLRRVSQRVHSESTQNPKCFNLVHFVPTFQFLHHLPQTLTLTLEKPFIDSIPMNSLHHHLHHSHLHLLLLDLSKTLPPSHTTTSSQSPSFPPPCSSSTSAAPPSPLHSSSASWSHTSSIHSISNPLHSSPFGFHSSSLNSHSSSLLHLLSSHLSIPP